MSEWALQGSLPGGQDTPGASLLSAHPSHSGCCLHTQGLPCRDPHTLFPVPLYSLISPVTGPTEVHWALAPDLSETPTWTGSPCAPSPLQMTKASGSPQDTERSQGTSVRAPPGQPLPGTFCSTRVAESLPPARFQTVFSYFLSRGNHFLIILKNFEKTF